MAYENLRLETADGIATITIARPEVMNALNFQTLTELSAAVDEVSADDSARVLIITGDGEKAFIAGADIGELKEVAGDAAGAGLVEKPRGTAGGRPRSKRSPAMNDGVRSARTSASAAVGV